MKITQAANLMILALFGSTIHTFALEGLKISLQSSNAVLSWPSQSGEGFIVRYRPDLNTNTTWVMLTNNLAAAANTNRTVFVHTGVVMYPNCAGGGGGGSGGPPAPGTASPQTADDTGGPITELDETTIAVLAKHRIFPPYIWDLEQRPPYTWEVAARPPAPWDPEIVMMREQRASTLMAESPSSQQLSLSGAGSLCLPATGFYQVVRRGIHLVGITNGMIINGLRTIPIEVGYDSALTLDSIYVSGGTNADQVIPIAGFTISGLPGGPLVAIWDTRQTTNGTYLVSIGAQLGDSRFSNSPPVSVIVSNNIWFPDAFNIAGYYIEVQAQSIYTNGTFHVDIYNDTGFNIISLNGTNDSQGYVMYQGARGFRVANFDPTTLVQYPCPFYNVAVRSTAAVGGATATSTNFIWVESPWPSNTVNNLDTQYAIAYQPIFGDPAAGGLNAVAIQTMIQDWYLAAESRDGGSSQGGWGVVRGDDQNPFELWDQYGFTTLLVDLHEEQVRNLFYFGHGSPNSIGQTGKLLNVADLFTGLHNLPKITGSRDHPFRFVFLDGCKTANGDLCKAFGIPKEKNMAGSRFSNKGLRYRAFLGWDKYVIIGWAGQPDNAHLTFMGNLLETWPQEKPNAGRPYTLREAIDIADTSYSLARNDLIIYGYEGLWFDDTIP